MLADSLQSEVVDATKPLHFQDEHHGVEKQHAARKYQRNLREKRKKQKLLKSVEIEYNGLVEDIRRLRLSNKNPDREVRKLNRIKKKQKKIKRIAYAQTSFKKVGCALLDGSGCN